jgi:hypothetical protein
MGRTTGTDPRLVSCIPLASRAEHKKDGLHCFAIINTGPLASQRMGCALGATAQSVPTGGQGYASRGGCARGHQASMRLLEENCFSHSILCQGPHGIASYDSSAVPKTCHQLMLLYCTALVDLTCTLNWQTWVSSLGSPFPLLTQEVL